MRAIVQDRFGPPDVLELREVDAPRVGDGEVLVRVRAASVNPADWYLMTGTPWLGRPQTGLRRPRSGRLGVDLAGEVAAVGRDVTRFRPGDAVFGTGDGTLAEYVPAAEARLALKPARLSFGEAAGRGRHLRRPARQGADLPADRGRRRPPPPGRGPRPGASWSSACEPQAQMASTWVRHPGSLCT